MRTHTNDFKNEIKKFGKQLECKITYGTTTLTGASINSVNFNYKSDILKSVMKQMEIDSTINIPLNTILKYELGLKVGNNYEYIDMGNFVVYEVEKQEDKNSYIITCCDKMLYSMKNYENMNITYPITIRNYINTICTTLGLTFANSTDTFVNYDKEIPYELYLDANGNDLGYTFRDVLDELAQATASTICINSNDELEIRYIEKTNNLPAGYTELEYIESNGSQYIDTGINADKNLRVILDMQYVQGGTLNQTNIGAIYRDTNNTYSRYHLMISSNKFVIYNKTANIQLGSSDYNRHIFDLDAPNHIYKLDGNSVENDFGEFDTNLTFYLFARHSNITNLQYLSYMKLYSCKMYYEGTLVRNFVPCIKNSTNKKGLYDLVNNVFYENQGTGNFAYGKALTDDIDESYLKDVNVKFGEKYGPVNSIVLSRSAESDNIARQDTESVEVNGICEIKIIENQIMNFNDRDGYLDEIFNQLNGLEYYVNDYKSTGIVYLDICDKYNVKIGNEYYKCIMFNDEIIQTQGLEENIFTEIPDESETDYTKTDKTDRRLNQAISMVDKQNLIITNLVSETQQTQALNDERILSLTERTNAVEQNITSTQATIEVMQRDIINGKETLQNNLVTIDINGINVSTNISAISTLMTNEKFVIKSGDTTLAFFGYDSTENVTKAEMNNLTITKYLVAGWHRIEQYERNGENRTGWFYLD